MGFTKTAGTITTTTTEADLFDVSGDKDYSCWIFLQNMQAGDSYEFKVYVYNVGEPNMRIYRSETFTGSVGGTGEPAVFVPNLPTSQYKITVKRLAGVDRVVHWTRIER